ncbi:MAG: MoaD/ThiS family protein, partial [Microgenomates group bacterium]
SHFEMILYYSDTVIDVLRKLKIPDSELFSIFINNKLVIRQRVILNEGDKIVFLPVVGGG